METIYLLGIAFSAVMGMMFLLWLVSLWLKNASIVDIFWGVGFLLVTWITYLLAPQGFLPRRLVLAGLTTVWAMRLSGYILWRNWGKAEDFRYRLWREQAGSKWWWQSFFKVFLLQGFLSWVISTPIVFVLAIPGPMEFTPIDILAGIFWLSGMAFEVIGDFQLARFKSDPQNRGKVMDLGLWKFTRHPNYFGETMIWWGYYLVAVSSGAWWTAFSPLLMTLLLVRVSGVHLLERTLQERPAYADYIRRTSAFIPWIPRKDHRKGTS